MSEPVIVVESARQMHRRAHRRDATIGAILAVVGAVFLLPLLGVTLLDMRSYIVLAIGLSLLLYWLIWRGSLVLGAGAVLTGVGLGIALRAAYPEQGLAVFLVGVGIGFLAVWLLALLTRGTENYLWPLVPGVVLVGAGLLELFPAETVAIGDLVASYWPIVLVAVGLVVLARALFSRPTTTT